MSKLLDFAYLVRDLWHDNLFGKDKTFTYERELGEINLKDFTLSLQESNNFSNDDEGLTLGDFCLGEKRIRVRPLLNKDDFNDILLHELFHAINGYWYTYHKDLPELTHEQIYALTNCLRDVEKNNDLCLLPNYEKFLKEMKLSHIIGWDKRIKQLWDESGRKRSYGSIAKQLRCSKSKVGTVIKRYKRYLEQLKKTNPVYPSTPKKDGDVGVKKTPTVDAVNSLETGKKTTTDGKKESVGKDSSFPNKDATVHNKDENNSRFGLYVFLGLALLLLTYYLLPSIIKWIQSRTQTQEIESKTPRSPDGFGGDNIDDL